MVYSDEMSSRSWAGTALSYTCMVPVFGAGFQLYGASIRMKCPQDLGRVLLFLTQYSVLHFAFPFFSVLFSEDPEIIALSEILRVNSCVWKIRHGYAEVIFRHLLTNPIPGTSTVHLHYASRRHYEFTDIGKVKTMKHLPMQSCKL
jgi:hypothetical protein